MASIRITIETNNAAFHDPEFDGVEAEVARLLDRVRAYLGSHEYENVDGMILRDLNGNTVGKVEVTD
jgi:hypothetical protein